MKAIQSLIWVVLFAAAVVFVLALGVVYGNVASTQADDSCSTSVLLQAINQEAGFRTAPVSCATEKKELSGSERAIRQDLAAAHARCKAQFAAALNNEILSGQDTFCHVCGVYTSEQGGEITGLEDAITPLGGEGRQLADSDSETLAVRETLEGGSLSLDNPIAVLFIQDKTEDFSLLTLVSTKEITSAGLGAATGVGVVAAGAFIVGTGGWGVLALGAVAGATGGIAGYSTGKVIDGPDGSFLSAIIIRDYEPEVFSQLGCTTLDPR